MTKNASNVKHHVEDIVQDMLFDESEVVAGDIAMKAFDKVTNEQGEVLSYTVRIKNKRQLYHVVDLLAAGLSFRQVSTLPKSVVCLQERPRTMPCWLLQLV